MNKDVILKIIIFISEHTEEDENSAIMDSMMNLKRSSTRVRKTKEK